MPTLVDKQSTSDETTGRRNSAIEDAVVKWPFYLDLKGLFNCTQLDFIAFGQCWIDAEVAEAVQDALVA